MRNLKSLIRRLLKFVFVMLRLRNTVFERTITAAIYSNPRLKAFVFGSPSLTREDVPELRKVILNLDHDEICSLNKDLQPISDLLNLPESDLKKYAEYLHQVGYREKSEQMPHQPLNFRVMSSFDYFLAKSIIKVERDASGYVITIHESIFNENKFPGLIFRILAVMRNYPIGVEKIISRNVDSDSAPFFYLDVADGAMSYEASLDSNSHVYSFCRYSTSSNVGLIPDAYTLHDLEYEVSPKIWKSEEEARIDFNDRTKKIFWRGTTTGRAPQHSISENRRIQFCLQSLEYPKLVDAKVTHVVHFEDNDKVCGDLTRINLTSLPVPETEFGKNSAYVDLDGNSSAWGTFRKYLRVIHVIKPVSPFVLFYHLLQPSDTFTSVNHESEIFRFLEEDSHYADNFEVAWRGYNFALKMRQMVIEGNATIFPK